MKDCTASARRRASRQLDANVPSPEQPQSEVEFERAYGVMLGAEGRGVRTIIDMVQHNRYYCTTASAGMMRQGSDGESCFSMDQLCFLRWTGVRRVERLDPF